MIRLKGENTKFFETQVNLNHTSQPYIPENSTLSYITPRTLNLVQYTYLPHRNFREKPCATNRSWKNEYIHKSWRIISLSECINGTIQKFD
jgi:hypothetical protein